MRIAFYCESPVDAAAMKVFAEAILGQPPEVPSNNLSLEAHGITGMFKAMEAVFRGLHYNTDAEGLVVVLDSDDTEIHDPNHENPGPAADDCRYCEIYRLIERTRRKLKPRPGQPELKVAIGLAVPTMEA